MAFFSVIIPVYNKEKFIGDTIRSVLAQTVTDFELILVNDGSTDQSDAVIQQFDDTRIRYFSNPNQGVSAARNFGIAQATSNYITFLDADDYWYPDFLEQIQNDIQHFPEQKIFAGAIEIELPQKTFSAQYSIAKSNYSQVVNYFDASVRTTAICTSCAAFHKSVFEAVGDFDTKIHSGQDTDLWIRMGLIYPVVFNPKILARYVYDPNSLSKSTTAEKLNFEKFVEAERSNTKLKKFLDLNRFSYAIKSKLDGNQQTFEKYQHAIDLQNLTSKKRILLGLPGFVLKSLLQVNLLLVRWGLSQSAFK